MSEQPYSEQSYSEPSYGEPSYGSPPPARDQTAEKPGREWYSISVSTIQRWTVLAVVLVAATVGFFLWRTWQAGEMEREAARLITRGEQLLTKLDGTEAAMADGIETSRDAQAELATARDAYAEGEYRLAHRSASDAVGRLEALLRIGSGTGSIRFVFLQGTVEYRRGERGAWKRARRHDTMDPGDWVKTGDDGTAQVIFADRTLYTLRSNTMVHLGGLRDRRAGGNGASGGGDDAPTDVVFGWVELNTAERGSRVSTPASEAAVDRDTEALVAYDPDQRRGRFAAYEGRMEVRSASGQTREVAANQQVTQEDELLSEVAELPGQPQLLEPPENEQLVLEQADRLVLEWRGPEDARRYRLQIAANRQFAEPLIDDERTRDSATLQLLGEGNFYWQVAALGADGLRGRWSPPRSFRVASLAGVPELVDEEPPVLELSHVTTFGDLVRLEGRTEPGATVTVSGQPIDVGLGGVFETNLELKPLFDPQDVAGGWVVLYVVATDAAGNETRVEQRIRVDVS